MVTARPALQLGYRFVDLASRQGHFSPQDLDVGLVGTALFESTHMTIGLRQETGPGEETQPDFREALPGSLLGRFEVLPQRGRILLMKDTRDIFSCRKSGSEIF